MTTTRLLIGAIALLILAAVVIVRAIKRIGDDEHHRHSPNPSRYRRKTMTYEQLLAAVKAYWADKSRTPEETKDDLGALIDEIEMLRDAL